jgi:hypothetical protein
MKTKTRILMLPIIVLGILAVLNSSCKKDDENPDSINDDMFFKQLGYSLVMCYTDIYNQNLAGHTTGAQNLSVNGPMGGTVTITGTTGHSSSNNITTTDLLFMMTSVNYTSSSNGYLTEITLSGPATYTGSFSGSYVSLNHQSENLFMVGTVTYEGTSRNIQMTGEVSINRLSSSVAANIFGNTVAW